MYGGCAIIVARSFRKLLQFFWNNQMKGNTDKCYLVVTTDEMFELRKGEWLIKSRTYEKLLDIKSDNKHNFNTKVKDVCKKADIRLRTPARAKPCMSLEKKPLIFFNAQLNGCPLIWMLHSRINNKIKHLHERCLRLVHDGKQLS